MSQAEFKKSQGDFGRQHLSPEFPIQDTCAIFMKTLQIYISNNSDLVLLETGFYFPSLCS